MRIKSFVIVPALVFAMATAASAQIQYPPTPEQQKIWQDFRETNPNKTELLRLVACSPDIDEPFKVLALEALAGVQLETWEGIMLLKCGLPEPYAGMLWKWLKPSELPFDDLLAIIDFGIDSGEASAYRDKADQELRSRDLDVSQLASIVSRMDRYTGNENAAEYWWRRFLRQNPLKEDLFKFLTLSRDNGGEHLKIAASELLKHYKALLTNDELRDIVVSYASLEDKLEAAAWLLSSDPDKNGLVAVAYSPLLEPYATMAMETLLAKDPDMRRTTIGQLMLKKN